MSTQREAAALASKAHRTQDPENLYRIAKKLDKLSQWEEAEEARRKAREIERRLAEAVNG